ncbi:hypothetical protein R6Q57_018032 [Mikania cordata]
MVAQETFSDNLTREQYVYLAKLAEQAERYEEMVKFMEKLVVGLTPSSELTVEERNLLSVAYKNVIGSLRAAWRIVSSIEQKEESRKNDDHVVLVKDYRSKVEDELSVVCSGILKILEVNLVPSASTAESKVFYLKMKGDYHRYLAEFKVGDERKESAEQTMNSYKVAQDIAEADLAPTHPIRLGLALNFSVFYYEILNSADKACNMAKQAFEDAIAELDTLGEDSYKDSTLIMQLLRDNLTLWTSDTQKSDKKPPVVQTDVRVRPSSKVQQQKKQDSQHIAIDQPRHSSYTHSKVKDQTATLQAIVHSVRHVGNYMWRTSVEYHFYDKKGLVRGVQFPTWRTGVEYGYTTDHTPPCKPRRALRARAWRAVDRGGDAVETAFRHGVPAFLQGGRRGVLLHIHVPSWWRDEDRVLHASPATRDVAVEFAVISGLYREPETVTPLYTAGITEIDDATLCAWWPHIAEDPFVGTKARVSRIRDPLI